MTGAPSESPDQSVGRTGQEEEVGDWYRSQTSPTHLGKTWSSLWAGDWYGKVTGTWDGLEKVDDWCGSQTMGHAGNENMKSFDLSNPLEF